jgi:lipopolysaccharide transport system permease protein
VCIQQKTQMLETIVFEAGRQERHLWRYRELLHVLAWRDLLVRHKQTAIGASWAVIRPFFPMAVFTVIFGGLAKLPSEGTAPYLLMVFACMLLWTFFGTGLCEAANSLFNNANLIGKVYFPQMIVPIVTVVVAFADFLVSFAILILLMIWCRYPPRWRLLWSPLLVPLTFLTSFGPSLWITALNVKYRDFRYLIPFIPNSIYMNCLRDFLERGTRAVAVAFFT